jgi:hypothetical protein
MSVYLSVSVISSPSSHITGPSISTLGNWAHSMNTKMKMSLSD